MTIKRIIYKLCWLSIFIFIAYQYFFYVDMKNDCYIRISPSILEFSNRAMKRAIKLIKNSSPEDYTKFCQNVKVINPNNSCGGFGGGCYRHNRKKSIDISTSNRSLLWTAGIIVHETCHSIQHLETRPPSEKE